MLVLLKDLSTLHTSRDMKYAHFGEHSLVGLIASYKTQISAKYSEK